MNHCNGLGLTPLTLITVKINNTPNIKEFTNLLIFDNVNFVISDMENDIISAMHDMKV